MQKLCDVGASPLPFETGEFSLLIELRALLYQASQFWCMKLSKLNCNVSALPLKLSNRHELAVSARSIFPKSIRRRSCSIVFNDTLDNILLVRSVIHNSSYYLQSDNWRRFLGEISQYLRISANRVKWCNITRKWTSTWKRRTSQPYSCIFTAPVQ